MSLYGALFGAVSGLNAQSSKIGAISDNIANSNTIGYKEANATFSSLVINTSNSGVYQTGGVRAGTQLQIDQQGLLQSTSSATDLAISGGGFFVVRNQPTLTATPLYTRAGSFTQDSLGNFINASSFYLQGWPLDREGRLPGEPGNLNTTSFTNFDSLRTVNVQSASGTAQSTSLVSLGANLNAGEVIFPGESATFAPDNNVGNNLNQPSDSVLIGNEYNLDGNTGDGLTRGDRFSVATGGGLKYTYEYGGFTVGRDVSTVGGSVNMGDGGSNNTALADLSAASSVQTTANAGEYKITIANHGLITGDKVTLSGFVAVGATPASQLNATHTITRVDANTFTFTVATDSGLGAGNRGASPDKANIRQTAPAGNILDAAGPGDSFLVTTGVSSYTAAALTFTVNTPATGTKTFTYTTNSPNTLNGEFNTLNTLADSINSVNGLTARVVNNRLVVGAENASNSLTFGNGDATGTATQHGLNWIDELGLANVATGSRRFNSMASLATLVTGDDGVSATINNPLSAATLAIRVDSPLDTIAFADLPTAPLAIPTTVNGISVANGVYAKGATIAVTIADTTAHPDLAVGAFVTLQGLTDGSGGLPGIQPNGGPYQISAVNSGTSYTVLIPAAQAVTIAGGPTFTAPAGATTSIAGISNQGSVLGAFGLTTSLNGTAYLTAGPQSTATLGPQYDPTGAVGKNMASGDITAQFSRNVEVFDGLGSGHNIRFSFLKIGSNRWAFEVHAIPPTDVRTGSGLVDGQIVTGTINFNGDGTLQSVLPATALNPQTVTWTNGSSSSAISLNLGTAGPITGTPGATVVGLGDGLSQFSSDYNVNFANQNGAPVGQLVSVAVDSKGVVIGSYSNGQTKKLFQLPLAAFADPNGMLAVTGNVFSQTRDSGEVNLRQAQSNGTGTVVSSTLEQSNVDLATQLTDMIVSQRAYQANTQVIKVANQLLDSLNQI